MIAYLDYGEFERTRKSLLVSSSILFVLNNLEISNDSLNFFGLEVGFDKVVFTTFLEIATIFLLFVFSAQAVGLSASNQQSRWQELVEKKISAKLKEIEAETDPNYQYKEDFKRIVRNPESVKLMIEERYGFFQRVNEVIISLTNFIVFAFAKVAFPTALALVAIKDASIAEFLSWYDSSTG